MINATLQVGLTKPVASLAASGNRRMRGVVRPVAKLSGTPKKQQAATPRKGVPFPAPFKGMSAPSDESSGKALRFNPLNVAKRGNVAAAPEDDETTAEDIALLFLRVCAASLMIHHGIDKVGNAEGFTKFVTAKYFGFLPNPLAWTYLAAYAQIVMPAGLIPGLATRLTSLVLLGTMTFACVFHFLATGLEGFPLAVVKDHSYAYETSALYAFIFIYLIVRGGGALSLDSVLGTEEKVKEFLNDKFDLDL